MERYIQKKQLGKGGYAKVYLAEDTVTGKEYAMKIIDISNMKPENYENEITLFEKISKLSHSNIVKYESSFIDEVKKKCVIIMEYCKSNVWSKV